MRAWMAVALMALAAAGPLPAAEAPAGATWGAVGNGPLNTRNAEGDTAIDAGNVARLQPSWTVTLKGTAASNPVSDGHALYLPTSDGSLYKLDRSNGAVLWQADLGALTGMAGASSKGAAVGGGIVAVGLQTGGWVAGLDAATGALLWKTQVEDHPATRMAQPPLIAGGRVFIGTAGIGEEAGASFPDYKCCSFRGSMAGLDAATGKLLWKTYTVPEGFAGGGIWSRTPSLDARRDTVYFTTGNMYQAPPGVKACLDRNVKDPAALRACYPAGVWTDSIVALEPATGRVKWGFRADDYDVFTGACLVPENGAQAHCGGGGDFDFGNGAMLWRAGGRDFVGAGQKSGDFWALDPDSGQVLWRTKLGPGGPNGGIQQASATDGSRVYVAVANTKQVGHFSGRYTLPDGRSIDYGSFAALDAGSGRVLWQVPDPAGETHPPNANPCRVDSPKADCSGAFPKAPVNVANGVVFGCSTAANGPLYAFEAASGRLLWRHDTGTACNTGPAQIDGVLYWPVARKLNAFTVAPKGPGS